MIHHGTLWWYFEVRPFDYFILPTSSQATGLKKLVCIAPCWFVISRVQSSHPGWESYLQPKVVHRPSFNFWLSFWLIFDKEDEMLCLMNKLKISASDLNKETGVEVSTQRKSPKKVFFPIQSVRKQVLAVCSYIDLSDSQMRHYL